MIITHNNLNKYYLESIKFCTFKTCPEMNAGVSYTYYWKDGNKTISIPACDYGSKLLIWSKEEINEKIIPIIDDNNNSSFLNDSSQIVKRLFRLYAHFIKVYLIFILDILNILKKNFIRK